MDISTVSAPTSIIEATPSTTSARQASVSSDSEADRETTPFVSSETSTDVNEEKARSKSRIANARSSLIMSKVKLAIPESSEEEDEDGFFQEEDGDLDDDDTKTPDEDKEEDDKIEVRNAPFKKVEVGSVAVGTRFIPSLPSRPPFAPDTAPQWRIGDSVRRALSPVKSVKQQAEQGPAPPSTPLRTSPGPVQSAAPGEPTAYASLLHRLASLRRIGERWGSSGELPRAASLDSIQQVRSSHIPKSILKRRQISEVDSPIANNSAAGSDDGFNLAALYETNPPAVAAVNTTADPSGGESTTQPKEAVPSEAMLRYKHLYQTNQHSSVPDLRLMPNSVSSDSIKKSTSTKQLNFDLENVKVIDAHSKALYNRKPDTNITVKKLTPKLKMEIREELNTYKRNEMIVHLDSQHHTVFH